METAQDMDALFRRLASAEWRERRDAVGETVALVRSAQAATRDACVARLVAALGVDDDAGIRNAAQDALVRVAPLAVDRLLAEVPSAPADVRILLAPILGESGDPRTVPALVELAASDDLNVAAAAITGLGRLRRREALGPLLDVLARDDAWLTFPAVEALGVLGDSGAVSPLVGLLDRSYLRATIFEALAQIATPEACRALADRALSGREPDVDALDALVRAAHERWYGRSPSPFRAAAAEAVRRAYRPERFADLAALAGAGPHAEVALEALGWTGDERALPVLVEALDLAESRVAAATGLAAFVDEKGGADEVVALAVARSASARLDAAHVLVSTAPAAAAELVVGIVEDEDLAREAADVAAEAAECLGVEGGSPAAHPSIARRLLEVLPTANEIARPALVRLVARLTGPEDTAALDAVRALLASTDPDVRVAAAELAVAWTGSSEAARVAVRSALADASRVRALAAAARWKDPGLFDVFVAAASDADPSVRRAAVDGLRRIEGSDAGAALAALCGDRHDGVAAAALAATATRNDPCAATALAAAARAGGALARCVAAERLAASPSRDDRAYAASRALEDAEAEVRRAAVAAFAVHPSPEARRVLDGAVRDPHRSVRAAAMRLASALGGVDVVELVRRTAVADRADDVRGEALVALAAVEPAGALPLVGRATFEPALAPYAVRALERIAERDPETLRRFHDEAPPRVAFIADVFLAGLVR